MGVPESKPTAIESFIAAMGEIKDPPKTKEVRAGQKKYSYAPLDEFLPSLRSTLLRHEFVLTFSVVNSMMLATIIHSSGETFESGFPMVGHERDPQAAGSASTYARRYALLNLLGLVADGDDDGETATRPPAPKAQTKTADEISAERKNETPEQKAERQAGHDPSWEKGQGKFFGQLKDIGIKYDDLLAYLYWLKEDKSFGSGKKPSDIDEAARSLLIKFLKSDKSKAWYSEWSARDGGEAPPELDPDIPF